MLIVLTGKTASGKDTLKDILINKYPNLKKVVTTTSRAPRRGEKDGIQYHFLSREEFQTRAENGDFIEYVEYGGNFYGTQKKDLEDFYDQDFLWRIDPSRAGEARQFLKRAFPADYTEELINNLKVIYITTSDEVVLERLKKRGLSDEEIQNRMADDAAIWQENENNYDYVVENVPGKLDQTIDKVIQIIENNPS